MKMDTKIEELKIRFRTASKQEIEIIDNEIIFLHNQDNQAFSKTMLKAIKQTNNEADELILKEKLKEILPVISVSYLAKNYFKKTPQWFYQRLNGNNVNGKEAHFTNNELKILSSALKEIGQKLSASASFIV
jgi:spore coat polysaccharide biosynthesis predicted glycosyltransferase SpsG